MATQQSTSQPGRDQFDSVIRENKAIEYAVEFARKNPHLKRAQVRLSMIRFMISALGFKESEAQSLTGKKRLSRVMKIAQAPRDQSEKSLSLHIMRRRRDAKRDLAKAMRRSPTQTEAILFKAVKARWPHAKFKAQVLLLGYIPDIYSAILKLGIEVDGASHDDQKEYDACRDSAMRNKGVRVVRIKSKRVLLDIESVLRELTPVVMEAFDAPATPEETGALINPHLPFRSIRGPKTKIDHEGQPCRKCQSPVVKKAHTSINSPKVKSFYYEYWFKCPNDRCRTVYMPKEAMRTKSIQNPVKI